MTNTLNVNNLLSNDKTKMFHLFGHSAFGTALSQNKTRIMYKKIPTDTIVFFRVAPGDLCYTLRPSCSSGSCSNTNNNNNGMSNPAFFGFFHHLQDFNVKFLKEILKFSNTSIRKKGQIYYPRDEYPDVTLDFSTKNQQKNKDKGIVIYNISDRNENTKTIKNIHLKSRGHIRTKPEGSKPVRLSDILKVLGKGIYIISTCRGNGLNNSKQLTPLYRTINNAINLEKTKKRVTNNRNRNARNNSNGRKAKETEQQISNKITWNHGNNIYSNNSSNNSSNNNSN